MTHVASQKHHYDQVAYVGDKSTVAPDDLERMVKIKSLIPQGVKSVLDCGCANGVLGNLLKNDFEVQGCDIASDGLKFCEFPTKECSLTDLPYRDNEFDLVISSEVLEHIPPLDFPKACAEISRVTKTWLLITVPNKENLNVWKQQCPHCGTIFHDAWHIRSVDEAYIRASFPDFCVESFFYTGHKLRSDHILRRKLRNHLLGYPKLAENRQCPLCMCFGTPNGTRRLQTPRSYAADTRPQWYRNLRKIALNIVPGRARWLGALLKAK